MQENISLILLFIGLRIIERAIPASIYQYHLRNSQPTVLSC